MKSLNISKVLSTAFLIIGVSMMMMTTPMAEKVYASLANFNASDFCKEKGVFYPDCIKKDFDNAREGEISCPNDQKIGEVFLHAGNGQNVYQLPHEGVSTQYSNNNQTVKVTLTNFKNDISWLGVTCEEVQTEKEPKPKLTFLCKAPKTGQANAYISSSQGFTPVSVNIGDYLFRVLNNGTGDITSYEIKLANTLIYTGGSVSAGGYDFFTITEPKAGLRIVAQPSGEHGTASTNETACEMVEEEVCEDKNATNYGEEGECEYPNTPTPTPTSTPTPTPNTDSSLATIDPSCESDTVTAIHKVAKDNQPVQGVRVRFTYNGVEQTVETDADGKATVRFAYTGDEFVNSYPDGFADAANFVTKETECESTPAIGSVLGASTDMQVYAETGVAEDVIMSLVGLAGAGLFSSGSIAHVRSKK